MKSIREVENEAEAVLKKRKENITEEIVQENPHS